MMGAFDEGGRYVPTREDCQPARPVGGDTREALRAKAAEVYGAILAVGATGPDAIDIIAAAMERAALDAQEAVRRAEALAETLRRERLLVEQIPRLAAAERILGALAGDR